MIQSFTMDGNGEYIWVVMPQSFGKVIESDGSNSKFIVGGLANSAWQLLSTNYTNSYNHTEPYYLYRTTTVQSGTRIKIEIKN